MRVLPIAALLCCIGVVGIGVAVWRSDGAAAVAVPASMPEVLAGKPQGHVYTSPTEEPSDVNPLTARGAVARSMVLAVTHDALLDRDPSTGALRNCLAVHHQMSADGLSCVFELRAGVTFSDGSPMTMADVLFAWQLEQAGHLPMGFLGAAFASVDGVQVLDARRLRVRFLHRHFAILSTVGESWLVVKKQFFVDRVRQQLVAGEAMPEVDSARFAELLDQIDLETGPGTGPYVLHNEAGGESNWRRRRDLLLVRHEASWRRRLRPGTWNFAAMKLLFRDHAGARNALLLGEVDWYSGTDIDELLSSHAQLAERYQKRTYDFPQLGVYRVYWNCRRPPFDDVRVRRALGMLIARDDVLSVLAGAGTSAVAHAKPGSAAYPNIAPLPFDPSAARELLRAAGFDAQKGRPLRVSLLALQGSQPLRRIVELMQDAARQAGVDLDVHGRDLPAFVAEQKRGEWDGALVLQWFDASGDPYRFLHSKGRSNDGGWHNEDADRLAEAAQVELDVAQRSKLWRQLHTIAHREQPVTMIVHPLASVLVRKDLQDFVTGAFGIRPEHAWVARSAQRSGQ